MTATKTYLPETPLTQALDGFQRWMVSKNVEYATEVGVATAVANLEANGYYAVAAAVEEVAAAVGVQ